MVGQLGLRADLAPVNGSIEGSWPAGFPWAMRIPIDHALASEDLRAAIRHVGPSLGSDHRPITVDLPARL